MEKAVIYLRTISRQQKDGNKQLDYQQGVITEFCRKRKYKVIKQFSEYAGSVTYQNPEFLSLLSFLDQHKGKISAVVVIRLDRITKSSTELKKALAELSNRKIRLEIAEGNTAELFQQFLFQD